MASTRGTAPESSAIAFDVGEDPPRLEVSDLVEQRQYALYTGTAVSPTAGPTGQFRFPIDDAVRMRTSSVRLPTVVIVTIRDETGTEVARTEHEADLSLPDGEYELELHAPVRIYLSVTGGVSVRTGTDGTHIEFDREAAVTVGVRSNHERPAATVTTTADPTDVMAAVSTFGSALKTTSPERAFPTFRGHPPAVELGDSLSVPDGVAAPDTGVTIQVPPEHRYVYAVGSLAYYLGATVEPGDEARLLTDAGFEQSLGSGDRFERTVERVLKQQFTLDCVTRTEGLYDVDLKARDEIEGALDVDLASLYEMSLAERVAAHQSVPYETVEPAVPDWKLTTHVAPAPTSVETLPYVVNDLAVVRTPQTATTTTASPQTEAAIGEFLRDGDGFTRSTAEGVGTVDRSFVQTETDDDALEHAWVGEETPVGMSKATETAYRHQFDREPTDGDITISVVCNDPEMAEEQDLLDSVYGSRDRLPFVVEYADDLTRADLRDAFRSDVDFLHYIGHIDDGGFRCADGFLDAGTLADVNVDAFLLNACRSYDQGLSLIDAGAIGGITTLSDVPNEAAVEMGYTIGRLLNCGFPLRAALEVAKGESVIGSQYLVVGDGGATIAQTESGTPQLIELTETDGDTYEIEINGYATSSFGMGTLFTPFLAGASTYYLNSGKIDSYELSEAELQEFLLMENVPVRVDGSLRWSYELTLDELSK
jgi:hypothetical protein